MPPAAYPDRIVVRADVSGGQPTFRNTRVPLRTVLASLAEGASTDEILNDFPALSSDDVNAAVIFACQVALDRLRRGV